MWTHVRGVPAQRAIIRSAPEDFRVGEVLNVEFNGSGEFDWVQVEKTGMTTETAARLLGRHAGVRDVSYSGLKDKNAVTTQWFSLHMRGAPSADWSAFAHQGCRVLCSRRHHRKLRRGTHRVNTFELRLREVEDIDAVTERLFAVREQGVPNYFGEQRFGRDGGNVDAARRWFAGERVSGEKAAGKQRRPKRFQRGLYLSAARSYLFNRVLAQRVMDGSWRQALEGEILILGDSNSVFRASAEEDLTARLERGEIHPTGPLPGRSAGLQPEGAAARTEQAVLADDPALCEGLARAGVDAARRSLRLFAGDLDWQGSGDTLTLRFTLPRGCFATALVRELVNYREIVCRQ